jgi:hypothetical protein
MLHQRVPTLNRYLASQNISEQVDEVALYKAFVAYGEILQCFIDWDHYDQPFGHVQYIEESACIRAVERANGTAALGYNTIIQVQRHSRGLQQQPRQEEWVAWRAICARGLRYEHPASGTPAPRQHSLCIYSVVNPASAS